MKKITVVIITILITVMSVMSVFANTEGKYNGKIDVNINGTYLDFDVDPIMQNNRVMVPMRKIFESLGATVEWNDSSKTITAKKDGKLIKLTIGSNQMLVNNNSIYLDAPATIVKSRALVPVRAVSEALEASVAWAGHGFDIVTISTYPVTCEEALGVVADFARTYRVAGVDTEAAIAKYAIFDIFYYEPLNKIVYDIELGWPGNGRRGTATFVDVYTGEIAGGAN